MISFFDENEYIAVQKERKTELIKIIVLAVIYALTILALMLIYAGLPYESEKGISIKIITYLITAVYLFLLYVTVGIKFKRIRKYYTMLTNLKTLTPVVTQGSFVKTIEDIETRDFVDLKTIVISVYVERRQSFFDRHIYIPYEREFPTFNVGQNVKFYTVENILVGYELLDGDSNKSDE